MAENRQNRSCNVDEMPYNHTNRNARKIVNGQHELWDPAAIHPGFYCSVSWRGVPLWCPVRLTRLSFRELPRGEAAAGCRLGEGRGQQLRFNWRNTIKLPFLSATAPGVIRRVREWVPTLCLVVHNAGSIIVRKVLEGGPRV